jgi:hypothetical protein
MAQYFIDFSNDAVDTTPQGFTPRWNTTDWLIVEDSNAVGGKCLKNSTGTNNPKHLGYHVLGSIDDVEVLSKVRNTSNGASQNRLHLRASTTSVSCYIAGLWANEVRLAKYVNGSFTTISSYSYSMQAGQWYWLRFRANGNNLYVKIWKDGDDEPVGWDTTASDNSHSSGEVGIGGWDMSGERYYDVFSVATDGETAPITGSKDYKTNGIYLSEVILYTGQARARWLEDKPTNTDITIEYTTGQTQGEWIEVSNGDVITSDTNLWFRVTLETTDTSVTPTLQDLWIEEPDAPQDKIRIVMDEFSRFPTVEGDLTVEYDASLGNLAGSGGAVESFIETFTPTGLVAEPNPGIHETITVAPAELTVDFIPIVYIDTFAEETDLVTVAPAELTVELLHTSVVNP